MVIAVIDEVKNSDAWTDVNDSIEIVNDFLVMASAAAAVNSRLGVLARRVLAIPATSAAPERLFSTAGNVMTKKRSSLTCDNMEELVYLHEVLPQVREWEAVKKMRLKWFFFQSMKHITFNVFSCLLFVDSETPSEWLWLWLLPASRLSFALSIHIHTRIHIVTIIVHYISWYWQNRHRPEFRLKRLLVPVTQSWYFTDTGPRTCLYHYCSEHFFFLVLNLHC